MKYCKLSNPSGSYRRGRFARSSASIGTSPQSKKKIKSAYFLSSQESEIEKKNWGRRKNREAA
jgi:hypothetical protein